MASLTAKFAGRLPDIGVQSAAIFDGQDSVFLMSGVGSIQGPPYYGSRDELFQYSISNGSSQEIAKFKNALSGGVTGTDGNGTCYQFGGVYYAQTQTTMYNGLPNTSIFSFSAQKPSPVRISDLPIPLSSHSAASDGNGSVYILGGHTWLPSWDFPSLEIYKFATATGKTEVKGYLNRGMISPATVWVNGALYIFGGGGYYDDSFTRIDVLKFTPRDGANGKLEVVGEPLNGTEFSRTSVVAVKTDIYVFGGFINNRPNYDFQIYKFDTLKQTLAVVPVTFPPAYLTYQYLLFGLKPLYIPKSNRIYIFGGGFQWAPSDLIFYFQL